MDPVRSALTASLVALSVAALAGPAASETRPRYGRSVTGSLLGEPSSVDPIAAQSHAEVTLAALIFDSLYRLDEAGDPVPELAAALPILDEEGRVLIPLRVGVKFHDGHDLAVADVVASLERLRRSRGGWLLAAVETITPGEGAVVLELRYPEPELARHLAATIAAITRDGRSPRAARPVGTGAFRLVRFSRPGREIRLAAFDGHRRPYLNAIRLRWFRSPDEEARDYEVGRTHLSLRGPVAFAGHQPKYVTESAQGPATVLTHIGFGKKHTAALASLDFRAALSLAINRPALRNLGSGERVAPTVSPVAAELGAAAAPASALRGDVNAARAALARAAARVPALRRLDRLRLEILVDRSRLDDRDVADKILAALYNLGITAVVVEVSAPVFARRVAAGACDFYVGQLAPPLATPAGHLAAAFAAAGDPWVAKRLAAGPLDVAGAAATFARRLPIVPLFHRAVRVHHRSDVRGVSFDGSSRVRWDDLFLFGAARRN